MRFIRKLLSVREDGPREKDPLTLYYEYFASESQDMKERARAIREKLSPLKSALSGAKITVNVSCTVLEEPRELLRRYADSKKTLEEITEDRQTVLSRLDVVKDKNTLHVCVLFFNAAARKKELELKKQKPQPPSAGG